MRRTRRIVQAAAGWCGGTLLLTLLTGCVWQPVTLATIFLRPSPWVKGSPADFGYPFDELMLPVRDGRQISIWHAKADQPKAIVVIVPGSDSNKSRYLIGLPVFIPHGYDVVLMDYEGFGASTGGRLDLERLTDDAFTAVRYAQTQHQQVVVFGISTGAAPAVRVAAALDVSAVIVEAPLLIERETEFLLRRHGVPFPPLWYLANWWAVPQIPESFNILKYIQLVDEPKLIMHSVEDDMVPYSNGVLVYEAAHQPKSFFEMRGGHGNMVKLDVERYTQTIISWLDGTVPH